MIMPYICTRIYRPYCRLNYLLPLLLIAACSDAQPGATNSQTSMSLAVPQIVSRVSDPSNQSVVANINGAEMEMENVGDMYIGSTTILLGTVPVVEITWYDDSEGAVLPVAEYSNDTLEPMSADFTLPIREDEYQLDGPRLDADTDGVANLVELRDDSDPFDINSPANSVHVNIPLTAENAQIDIDGRFKNTSDGIEVWEAATQTTTTGLPLRITNLISGEGPEDRFNGIAGEHFWRAFHDGTSLYLFILGEDAVDSLHHDSDNPHDDDSLNIFIDSDNSKNQSYDNVNDYHIVIPLVTRDGEENGTGVPGSRLEPGQNSAVLPPNAIEFGTCICDGFHRAWEVKLNMAAFGLSTDAPFGLEIQLDEDNDGGARDARWAWALHTVRAGNAEHSEDNPSALASVQMVNTRELKQLIQ